MLLFIVLHFLVYPASNAYNSFHDKDTGSIGGLKNPPPINTKVLVLANILDFMAILLSLILGPQVALLVFIYIAASRLYSNRQIRLKKYPIVAFLIVFFFQGAFTFLICILGVQSIPFRFNYTSIFTAPFLKQYLYAFLACSLQIGAIYPLTQIYQHKSDLEDGVSTLSNRLGYVGSFIFSGSLFIFATISYFLYFKDFNISSFYVLMIAQLPIITYFSYWFILVLKDNSNANFTHTMRMNTIAAVFLNLFFLYLVIS